MGTHDSDVPEYRRMARARQLAAPPSEHFTPAEAQAIVDLFADRVASLDTPPNTARTVPMPPNESASRGRLRDDSGGKPAIAPDKRFRSSVIVELRSAIARWANEGGAGGDVP